MVSLHAAIAAIALSSTGQTVLLDFYADWCGPCKAMDPTVQALAAKGYAVQRVNIDRNKQLAAKYKIQSIPCFVMVVDGQEVDRVTGGTTFSRLERMCKMGTGSPAGNRSPPMLAINPNNNSANVAPPRPSALAAPFDNWDMQAKTVRNAPLPQAEVSDADLIAVSVRLRVEDPNGHSCGSGTIIDAREGQALILTCGHIFRDSHGKGKIEVDLFGAGGQRRVPGELVWHSVPDIKGNEGNAKADIGLVAIREPYPLKAARVAPPGYQLAPGAPVANVGCNNGDIPTVQRSKITSLNKFVGAPNVQVAGQPVEGRSGGGLFSSDGYVLGVCNAADPSDREGLFAALDSIHTELDRAKLAFIYQSPNVNPAVSPAMAAPIAIAATNAPPKPIPALSASPQGEGSVANFVSWNSPTPPTAATSGSLPPQEQAALDEIHRRKKEGAEIVIIVRPRDNPEAKSEIFMLDRASPEFRKQISNESKLQEKMYQETSLELPRPRRVILEWSADGKPAANDQRMDISSLPPAQ